MPEEFDHITPIHITMFDGSEVIIPKNSWALNEFGIWIYEGHEKTTLFPWSSILRIHQFNDGEEGG